MNLKDKKYLIGSLIAWNLLMSAGFYSHQKDIETLKQLNKVEYKRKKTLLDLIEVDGDEMVIIERCKGHQNRFQNEDCVKEFIIINEE